MQKLALINGNGQKYTVSLPKIVIMGRFNDTAREHIFEETALLFKDCWSGSMEAQPHSSQQIAKLFLTYNFKTRYFNNADLHNTLMLKSDHHVGFQVDSICFDCCKENHINVNGLKQGDRLSC